MTGKRVAAYILPVDSNRRNDASEAAAFAAGVNGALKLVLKAFYIFDAGVEKRVFTGLFFPVTGCA